MRDATRPEAASFRPRRQGISGLLAPYTVSVRMKNEIDTKTASYRYTARPARAPGTIYNANLGSEVDGPSFSTEEGRLVLGTYAS